MTYIWHGFKNPKRIKYTSQEMYLELYELIVDI